MNLSAQEWMRETLNDLSKDELSLLFRSLQDHDDCELGRVTRKMLYVAVQNFNEERAEELEASRAVDAQTDRRLAVGG